MSTTTFDFPGARWWKFDFHAHTPASLDYGKGQNQAGIRLQTTQAEWLLAYMRAGIDCVAITDHNTGAWVDSLKRALGELKTHAEYRPMTLFPGVEISVNGGVHVLGILGAEKTTADVLRLLGACGYHGTAGESAEVTEKTLLEVVREIAKAGALPILAHVDEPQAGAFAKLTGATLQQLVDNKDIAAIEVCKPVIGKPAIYEQRKRKWTEVVGSDAHHPSGTIGQRYPGSHFTWVKMDTPTLDGVRLALLDGAPMSIRRSDAAPEDPRQYAENIIEEISIDQARYCGRPKPLRLQFNPQFNALIGGRGSGKSSVVEFLRLALRREKELTGKLAVEFQDFSRVPRGREDQGALLQATRINVIYRKGPARYRLNWEYAGATAATPSIEEFRDGEWIQARGDIPERFRIRIFSQRQVFSMAQESEALLRVVDESKDVRRGDWDENWKQEQARYLSLMAKSRELTARLGEESKIRGELDDVLSKLKIFEGAEHAKVLREYQQHQRQRRIVQQFGNEVGAVERRIREFAEDILPADVDRTLFEQSIEGFDMFDRVENTLQRLKEIQKALMNQADAAAREYVRWQGVVKDSIWELAAQQSEEAYRSLTETLRGYGAGDPSEYSSLVQRRQILEQKQKSIVEIHVTLENVLQEANESLGRLLVLRRELSTRRSEFLTRVLKDNPLVQISLQPYGRQRRNVEAQFRRLVNREDDAFAGDILAEDECTGFVAEIYRDLPEDANAAGRIVEERLAKAKQSLLDAAQGNPIREFGQRFQTFLTKVGAEVLDRLRCWFPEDTLAVAYSQKADGQSFRPIQQASPGQKTAAILAFLMAYGDEPIVLDQPEDDLDNHLIYDLIVRQLRSNKLRRQIIVVTHNPNIVVNGDAELVFAMDNRGGQCQVIERGSLQDPKLREEICRVMEGGREAFALRYRRIGEGGSYV